MVGISCIQGDAIIARTLIIFFYSRVRREKGQPLMVNKTRLNFKRGSLPTGSGAPRDVAL
jgi:hypothetical protein